MARQSQPIGRARAMTDAIAIIRERDAAADRLSATPPPDDRGARYTHVKLLGTAMSAGNDLVNIIGTGARSATEQIWGASQEPSPGQSFQWEEGASYQTRVTDMLAKFTAHSVSLSGLGQDHAAIVGVAGNLRVWSCEPDPPEAMWYVEDVPMETPDRDDEGPTTVRTTRTPTRRGDYDRVYTIRRHTDLVQSDAFDYLRRHGFISKALVRGGSPLFRPNHKNKFQQLIAYPVAWLVMLIDAMAYLDAQSVCERVFRVTPGREPGGAPTCAFPSIVHHPTLMQRLGPNVDVFNLSLAAFFAYLDLFAPTSTILRAARSAPNFVAYVNSFKTTQLADIAAAPRPPIADLFDAPPGESTIAEALEFFRLPRDDTTELLDLRADMSTAEGVLAYRDRIVQGTHTPTVGLLVSSRAFLVLMMSVARDTVRAPGYLKECIERVMGGATRMQNTIAYANILMETGDVTVPAYVSQKTVSSGSVGALWGAVYTTDPGRIVRTRLAHRKDWYGALWTGARAEEVRAAWRDTTIAAFEAHVQTPWERAADWIVRSIPQHDMSSTILTEGEVPPMWKHDPVCTLVCNLWGKSRVANNLITAIGINRRQESIAPSSTKFYQFYDETKATIVIDNQAKSTMSSFFWFPPKTLPLVEDTSIDAVVAKVSTRWPMYTPENIERMVRWVGYDVITATQATRKNKTASSIVEYFPLLALVCDDMPKTIFLEPEIFRGGLADSTVNSLNERIAQAMMRTELNCETIDSTRGPAIAVLRRGTWLVSRAAERAISTAPMSGMMTSRALSDFSLSASYPRAIAYLKRIPEVAWSGVAFEVLSDPSSSVYFNWPTDRQTEIGKPEQALNQGVFWENNELLRILKSLPEPEYDIGWLEHVFVFPTEERVMSSLIKEYARPAVYLLWLRELKPAEFKEHTDTGAPVPQCDLLTTIEWANNYVTIKEKGGERGVQHVQYRMKTVQTEPTAKFGADAKSVRHAIRIDFAPLDSTPGAAVPLPLYFVKTYPDWMADPPKKK